MRPLKNIATNSPAMNANPKPRPRPKLEFDIVIPVIFGRIEDENIVQTVVIMAVSNLPIRCKIPALVSRINYRYNKP